jgi:hypothetical protein
VLGSTSTALAVPAVCVPTDLNRDGHFLTAALVNPPAVTGPVDATGCDIGVYVRGVATTITGADIFGATYFGVAVNGTGSSATISNSSIHRIGEPVHNGSQHGVGVYYVDGATGSIDSSKIYDFQKNGTVFGGTGTHVDITNSTVTGDGPVSYIAQNGIEYIDHAAGTARGNTVTDIFYTGCSQQDAKATGCVPFVAVGILLYNIDQKDVDTSQNFYRDDQRNLFVVTSSSLGG